jgi:hypothetical protein
VMRLPWRHPRSRTLPTPTPEPLDLPGQEISRLLDRVLETCRAAAAAEARGDTSLADALLDDFRHLASAVARAIRADRAIDRCCYGEVIEP